jgi:hypothetical protein
LYFRSIKQRHKLINSWPLNPNVNLSLVYKAAFINRWAAGFLSGPEILYHFDFCTDNKQEYDYIYKKLNHNSYKAVKKQPNKARGRPKVSSIGSLMGRRAFNVDNH